MSNKGMHDRRQLLVAALTIATGQVAVPGSSQARRSSNGRP